MSLCMLNGFSLGGSHEHFEIRWRNSVLTASKFKAVPSGNLVTPPELARNAPGLDILQPLEVGLFPVFRDEAGLAQPYRLQGRLRQSLGVDIPLLGQPGLDD